MIQTSSVYSGPTHLEVSMAERKPAAVDNMKRINIYIGAKQYQELKRVEIKTSINFSEHIRRAIDEYLEGLRSR